MSDVSPSRRTVSSLGTDFESEAYGLIVHINRGAMGSGTFAPFFTFLVENLVVWIKMLTFVPLIQI